MRRAADVRRPYVLAAGLIALSVVTIGGYFVRPRHDVRPTAAAVFTPVRQQRVSHGRFEDIAVYVPHAAPIGFVLLLSDVDGWSPSMNELALHVAARGAMVAAIEVAKFDAALEADPAPCVFPDGDLENLSHFVQAYFRLPTYLTPIVAGRGAGAALAYAAQVQAPQSTFAGAVSMDFCPSFALSKPLCKGSGVEFISSQSPGVEFLPFKQAGNPWTVLESPSARCDVASVRNFVRQVPGAKLFMAPGAEPAPSVTQAPRAPQAASATQVAGAPQAAWIPVDAAFDSMLTRSNASAAAPPGSLADLPIITVPAQPGSPPSDSFAILLSGDGGWAGLDKEVAAALAADGIAVVGLDSLRYFWGVRDAAGLAADIDRMTGYYLAALGKQRVMLIGYSQGADVLPFAVNRLSAATRARVSLAAVMGMSEHALFEFHMSSWLSDDNTGPATLPEVDRIAGLPVLCIYGEDEADSLCPKLDPRRATVVKLKGGHHFDGDYASLARTILASAHPRGS